MVMAFTRIQRECKEVVTSKEIQDTGIMIEILNENLSEIKGTVRGPPDTPYEGGLFELAIKIPDSYPFTPPKVKFITKIWHPNVSSQTGLICLDILDKQWAASLTLRTVLLSVQSLLCSPEPKDPQDAVVAKQYMSKPEVWKETALYWTWRFANGPKEPNKYYKNKVDKMCLLGANDTDALVVLSNVDWDLEKGKKEIRHS